MYFFRDKIKKFNESFRDNINTTIEKAYSDSISLIKRRGKDSLQAILQWAFS